jgi:REP element-mobilizing transposase RayT
MARPLRIEYPGAVYHVTSRGNAGQAIFHDDEDRERFLAALGFVVSRHGWLCHAYCLMNNHYHLLLETPAATLSDGMRQLNGLYTQRFNRRHGQKGHVLQGRFKSILVDREAYLLELVRYVVLNPVRAGAVEHPGDWEWSSHRATAGEASPPTFLTTDWILAQFGARRPQAQEHYRRFVAEGAGRTVWEHLRGGVILGDEAFVEFVRPRLAGSELAKEIPVDQRLAARPSLHEVFKGTRSTEEKEERTYAAYAVHRYTLMKIGEHLGLHYSTVSKRVQRERERQENLQIKI